MSDIESKKQINICLGITCVVIFIIIIINVIFVGQMEQTTCTVTAANLTMYLDCQAVKSSVCQSCGTFGRPPSCSDLEDAEQEGTCCSIHSCTDKNDKEHSRSIREVQCYEKYKVELKVDYEVNYQQESGEYTNDCQFDEDECKDFLMDYPVGSEHTCYYHAKYTDIIQFEEPKPAYWLWVVFMLVVGGAVAFNYYV